MASSQPQASSCMKCRASKAKPRAENEVPKRKAGLESAKEEKKVSPRVKMQCWVLFWGEERRTANGRERLPKRWCARPKESELRITALYAEQHGLLCVFVFMPDFHTQLGRVAHPFGCGWPDLAAIALTKTLPIVDVNSSRLLQYRAKLLTLYLWVLKWLSVLAWTERQSKR